MDQIVKALTPAEIAVIEAREAQKQAEGGGGGKMKPPPPKFIGDEEDRKTTLVLEFPVEWGGLTFTEITVTRPTIKVWKAYTRAVAEAIAKFGPDAEDTVDQPFITAPAVVINSLDFIDGARLEGVIDGFFDRASLPNEETAETSEVPEDTSSTSDSGEPSPGS
ncbi:hypothetical protein [Shinella sp. JR1-6]|uniref:hypothetical protein n=1 Tax=Shinella sp. JR1-6 TaxID=2527671 RepID=UPI00102D54C2|nr:hypothetical protein [Shinella sp. JR1-6]TAA54642.1 hypothetical protein EXZ48_26830 [Shinella sp. JR1-6]